MTTAAEQYRRLVAKLEAINPSGPVNEADNIDPNAPAAQSAMNVASDNIPQVSAVPQAAADAIPTIGGSYKQAYAQAAKQGLKQFKWCGTYAVKDKPQPVNPMPAASAVQPRFLGQGPSDATLKDKYGRPLPQANQDIIRKGYDDSAAGV
jgi:hypothetical protein